MLSSNNCLPWTHRCDSDPKSLQLCRKTCASQGGQRFPGQRVSVSDTGNTAAKEWMYTRYWEYSRKGVTGWRHKLSRLFKQAFAFLLSNVGTNKVSFFSLLLIAKPNAGISLSLCMNTTQIDSIMYTTSCWHSTLHQQNKALGTEMCSFGAGAQAFRPGV